MALRSARSLRHEYELFIEQEIENYKESIPRSALLAIGDEAAAKIASEPQFALTELLRVPEGKVTLASFDPRSTPGFDGGKSAGKEALEAMDSELSELQERLFAQGRSGGTRRILLVLQGMDTAGKGGTVRHVVGVMRLATDSARGSQVEHGC